MSPICHNGEYGKQYKAKADLFHTDSVKTQDVSKLQAASKLDGQAIVDRIKGLGRPNTQAMMTRPLTAVQRTYNSKKQTTKGTLKAIPIVNKEIEITKGQESGSPPR